MTVSLWHTMKVRLGLEDEWDEEYDDGYCDPATTEVDDDDSSYERSTYESPASRAASNVRRVERESDIDRARGGQMRSVPSDSHVSQMTPQVKMHIAEPKSFTEAQAIADKFKQGIPVIMNMSMTQPDLAKRFIDFASGLTYGLDGGLQKVSEKVFMLTPSNVDVSAGEVRRMHDKGMFSVDG